MLTRARCACTIDCLKKPTRAAAKATAVSGFLDDINPNSVQTITAQLELGLKDAKPSESFQFERHGYFVADRKDSVAGKPVFNRTVTLRDAWQK